jgi:hypothetical protein
MCGKIGFKESEMNNQTKTNIFQKFCVASSPEALIAFGRTNHWFFLKENEKGVIDGVIVKDGWVYQPYDPDSITIPKEAQRKLDAVIEARFPIKQVIYGYEVKVATENKPQPPLPQAQPQQKPNPKPQPQIKPQPLIADPEKTLEAVAGVAGVVLTLVAGACMVMAYGFLMAISAVDPKLIVVVSDINEEYQWTCLSSWEQSSEA